MADEENLDIYLKPGIYIDSDSPEIIEFAESNCNMTDSPVQKAVSLFYAVRDKFRYNPYGIVLRPEAMTASNCVVKKDGYCITKAIILCAVCRAAGIPSRLGIATVRNHLTTKKLMDIMKTDVFFGHGYTELWLNGSWKKVTPAFNRELCEKVDVDPLEFDGEHDALLQPFNRSGGKYLEYIEFYGTFADVPFDWLIKLFHENYPDLYDEEGYMILDRGHDFEKEAEEEKKKKTPDAS